MANAMVIGMIILMVCCLSSSAAAGSYFGGVIPGTLPELAKLISKSVEDGTCPEDEDQKKRIVEAAQKDFEDAFDPLGQYEDIKLAEAKGLCNPSSSGAGEEEKEEEKEDPTPFTVSLGRTDKMCGGAYIKKTDAWALAPESGGKKEFDTPEYKSWVEKAQEECVAEDSDCKFVTVWNDAGWRGYKADQCTTFVDKPMAMTFGAGEDRTTDISTKVFDDPFNRSLGKTKAMCAGEHFHETGAWALTNGDNSGGTKEVDTAEYMGWVKDAQSACIDYSNDCKFVTVWNDAGWRGYKAGECSEVIPDDRTTTFGAGYNRLADMSGTPFKSE